MDKLLKILLVFVLFILCYLLSALVHELGHILCGIFHRWRLFLLIIGPVKLYRETMDGKLKIGLEKNVALWGGAGGTFPREESEDNLKIWGRILLAGPLASIIVGVLLLPVDFLFDGPKLFLVMLAWISIGMGAACLIPSRMKTGLLYNDGTRYKRLKNGGQEQAEEEALFKMAEMDSLNPDLEEFPESITEPLIASKDNEMKYYGYFCLYHNARKKNDQAGMDTQIANMEKIRDKTAKAVVEECAKDINK